MLSSKEQMAQLSTAIITDCDEERIALPCLRDSKIKASTIWAVLKDLAGKDLSRFAMPVILNEPLTGL